MPTIVRAANAAQFLSLVPHLLGFVPSRSLVVVPMCRGRSLGAMRVDLPADPAGAASDAVAATVVGMACRIADADGAMVVVYTDAAVTGILPHRALVQSLCVARRLRLPIADALVVAADGWGSYVDRDLVPGGRPLTELVTHDGPGGAAGDQTSGAALPKPDGAAARRCGAGGARALDAALGGDLRDRAVRGGESIRVAAHRPGGAGSGVRAGRPALAVRAGAGVEPGVARADARRDDRLVPGPARPAGYRAGAVGERPGGRRCRDGRAAQVGGRRGVSVDLASVMWGEGRRPYPQRLEGALELARVVAALLPKARRAGALAVCGWLAWALGRSTHADRYAAQALRMSAARTRRDRAVVRHGRAPAGLGIPAESIPSGDRRQWMKARRSATPTNRLPEHATTTRCPRGVRVKRRNPAPRRRRSPT